MTTIRTAIPGDAAAIAEVHMRSRREAMPWLPNLHTDAETVWWIAEVVLPSQRVWVAEDDTGIVGYSALEGSMLEQLYVRPDAQGRGIGSDLLDLVIAESGDVLRLWTFQRNHAARSFYERRGFQPVRFTDGSGNEEQEPDVLYYRSTLNPILFVDIDGVLNPFGVECPPGFTDHDLFPDDDLPIRICADHADWLAELAREFQLVWATGWSEIDRAVLARVLAFPPFHGAATMPDVPFAPAGKVPGVDGIAQDHACAWIDDLVTPEAVTWAENRDAPTLLVETQSDIGLTRQHVDELLAWRRELRANRDSI